MNIKRKGWRLVTCGVTLGALVLMPSPAVVRGDEPGLIGRLFRRASGDSTKRAADTQHRGTPATGTDAGDKPGSGSTPKMPEPSAPIGLSDVGAPEVRIRPDSAGGGLGSNPSSPSTGGGNTMFPSGPASAPESGNTADMPIRPQPRNSRSVTEADPILTRVALGRTNDGGRFGMFMQVFADGTVIDSEGVHHASSEAMRGLVSALQAPELARAKGHCGSPPTDFIEQVHVVIYRKKMNSLMATSFSYSGNTVGCDNSIRNLHAAMDSFQATLSPGSTTPAAAPTETAATTPAPGAAPSVLPAVPPTAGDPAANPPLAPVFSSETAPPTAGAGASTPDALDLTGPRT